MKAVQHRSQTFKGRIARIVGMLLATALLVLGVGIPATSAANGVSVVFLEPTASVRSGETILFTANWECGDQNTATCSNGRIEVPVPQGMPGNFELGVGAISGAVGDSYPGHVEGTGSSRVIVWNLPANLTTGGTQTVWFEFKTSNYSTPDGTTVTPEISISSSNLGNSHAVSPPVTILSDVELKVSKQRQGAVETATGPEDPYVGNEVTYKVRAGYARQWSSTGQFGHYSNMCDEDGIWAMQNLVVTDHLPEGVDFVSANLGGEYDESTNTVTWNLGDSVKMIDGFLLCDATTFGQEMFVTVRFPAERFTDAANNHELQTNTVTAQANAWGDENHELTDDAATSHYLQIGADGEFTLQKGQSYAGSNGQGWQFTRGQHTSKSDAVRGYLNQFSIKGTGNASGTWSLVDVLPCGWTSPESADDTDCDTPAFTDISFGANGNMSELQVHWITNASRTGVCTIPSGSNAGDTHVRFCEGLTSEDDIAMGDGEWITKFWLDDNPVKAGSAGKLFLFGTVSDRLPIDNSQAVADGEYQPHFLTTGNPPGGPTTQGTPVRGVTPSSEHPLWVTVENCTYDNTIIWNDGSATRNGSLVDSNHEGRCGYVRVARDVINVYAEKRMYNPDRVGEGGSSASPFFTPGEPVRIDVVTQRDEWAGEPKYDQWFFTPKVTEILPENLMFDPKDPEHPVYLALSGEGSDTAAQVIARLGEPRLTLDEVTIDGAARTKILIDFPDALADAGLELTQEITIGFDARVKENSPRSTRQNYLLVQADQAEHSYLVCASTGKYADPEKLTPTTTWGDLEFDNAVQGPDANTGCRTGKTYSIVDGPGMAANKQVKGTLDSDFVFSPHIGSTDRAGQGEYRIPLKNTGNVDMRGVVLYDLLPRVGDNGVKPGAGVRDSAFDVFMTGPVTGLPADTVVQYSTQDEPCRGELAGQGGGSRASAPAGCSDDWFTGAPADWADVTAIRFDFGDRVWKPGDTFTGLFPAVTGEGGDLTGVAWNNVAFAALRASNGTAMLPSEASKVGLQLNPDLSWKKVDGLDPTKLLAGSEWTLSPVLADGKGKPAGDWPKIITDCTDAANCGEDRDPEAGKFLLKGIPWGTYELTETKAPEGYAMAAEPIRFTVGSEHLNVDEWVYELGNVSNYKAGAGLTWQKVDPKGERLKGAEWQLVPVDEKEEPIVGAEAIDVIDCVADSAGDCEGIDQSPEGGVFTLASVAPGKYHLIETKAPAGYQKLKAPILVTIAGDTAVDLGEIENHQVEVPVLPLTGGVGTLIFVIVGGLLLAFTLFFAVRTIRARRLT